MPVNLYCPNDYRIVTKTGKEFAIQKHIVEQVRTFWGLRDNERWVFLTPNPTTYDFIDHAEAYIQVLRRQDRYNGLEWKVVETDMPEVKKENSK